MGDLSPFTFHEVTFMEGFWEGELGLVIWLQRWNPERDRVYCEVSMKVSCEGHKGSGCLLGKCGWGVQGVNKGVHIKVTKEI